MSDARIERVAPCSHGLVNNHDYGPPHDPIECIGGFRTVLSGFPPEAEAAIEQALMEWLPDTFGPWLAEGTRKIALAAAWEALTTSQSQSSPELVVGDSE